MDQKKTKSRFKLAVIVIVVVVVIVQIIATGSIAAYLIVSRYSSNNSSTLEYESVDYGKYILYIGTNDKDTYTPLISLDEAKAKVNNICSKYVDGYTVSEAEGGWVDEKGMLTEEMTLVYSISGADEADIISIMDEVLVELNQNSIMVERQDLTYCYYQGE